MLYGGLYTRMHGCVEAGFLPSPHSAQKPLDMDNNLGITKSAGSMVNCGINRPWNIWKYKCLKWYSMETHRIVNVITTILTDLVVSILAQFQKPVGRFKISRVGMTRISLWETTPLVDFILGHPKWCYQPSH